MTSSSRQRACRARRDERGAAALELVVIVPGLVLILGMMIAGGRLWFARTSVVEAANAGARAASLARTTTQAGSDGRTAVEQSMRTSGLRCSHRTVTVDTSAFRLPAGTPATVRTRVTCRVPLADLTLPVVPGSVSVTGDGATALDTYRTRS